MKSAIRPRSWWLTVCALGAFGFTALAAPPVVKTVPWVASNPLIPHTTYSGKTIRLKGTCDQSGSDIQWSWDFGDGSPTAVGTVIDQYAIEASHAYAGVAGTVFTARLTVQNTSSGETGTQAYYVSVEDRTLPVEVNIAIDEGLWYLHKTQHRHNVSGADVGDWTAGGYAGSGYYGVTAANLNAFEVNGHLETGSPDNPYTETVQRGMRRVFQWLYARGIGFQTLGNPDSNGNGYGVALNQSYQYYQGGMFMDAIVASGTPNAVATTGPAPSGSDPGILGRTYRDIMQDMVDDHAWAQYDHASYGGWRYSAQDFPDNSACQWAAIGLIAAERTWGCTPPAWVKTANVNWLAYSQNSSSGLFGYTDSNPVWGPYATTPSGMVQMIMDGLGRGMTGPNGRPSWDKAETFMRDNFANGGGAGNAVKDYYYGLFSFVKSMLLHQPSPIVLLQSQTVGVPPIDWYAAEVGKGDPTDGVARTLVDDQDSGGFWFGHNMSGDQYYFETAWAIMMLHRTLFESGAPVAVAKAIPNPAIAGQVITLDGSDSYHQDPARSIVAWDWDTDSDGVFDASGPLAAATFATVGDYPITLRVTDDNAPAKTAQTIITVRVTNPPVAPTADANGPYIFCPAWAPWFLDARWSVNPDEGAAEPHSPPYPGDTIQEYAWDLDGDGAFDDASGPTPDVTAFFTATGPGSYLISLKVTDTTATSYPGSGMGDLSDTATAQVFVLASTDPRCTCVTLTAIPVLKAVQLTWTPYAGAAAYNVYRSALPGGPYLWVGNTVTSPFIDAPGVLDQVYYYVVRPTALNGDEYCQSNEVAAEPLHPPPTMTVKPASVSNLQRYYYNLIATSDCFGRMQLGVYVGDTASPQVVGPIPNWSSVNNKCVYIRTHAPVATQRPGSGAVMRIITVKGSARVWTADPLGQVSTEVIIP